MSVPHHEDTRDTSVARDGDTAASGDDEDLDGDDDTLDQATHEEMIENLLARVVVMRRRWAMVERERHDLRRALQRVERERDEYRAEHERALHRAEVAELRLADIQGRITALEDSLQQRRRDRGGSAKLAGARQDVGQGFK
jgi:chromosome segregation ATPase